ncbi:MAG: hypothetical protein Q4G48_04990 [Bacteroidia bacterium]|nr:hypothetical protein [Bacteroidia bacterium]
MKVIRADKKIIIWILLLAAISCSKDDSIANNNEVFTQQLPGVIYFHFAGKYGYVNFKENKYVHEFATKSDFGGFDVSLHGKNILIISGKGFAGTDRQRMIYRPVNSFSTKTDIAEGSIFNFVYQWNDIALGGTVTRSYISPNEAFIAVNASSSAKHPIALIHAGKDETIETFRDENISLRDHSIMRWTADNSLWVNVGGSIFKINESNNWEPISMLQIPGTHATVNAQGTKIVFRHNKHLYMCNTNGSDLRQITKSRTNSSLPYDGERLPEFSPDGKYIAFGSQGTGAAHSWENPIDGSVVGTASNFGYLTVIPADGKLYDVDNANSGVIFPLNSQNKLIAVDGQYVWR